MAAEHPAGEKTEIRALLARPFFGDVAESCRCVVDTSTLIYLDRLELVSLLTETWPCVVPDPVIAEFGRPVPGSHRCPAQTGTADEAVLQTALAGSWIVLSEDGGLLRRACRQGLEYYNTLMVLAALVSRQRLSPSDYRRALAELRSFARYSRKVWETGEQVAFRLLRQDRERDRQPPGR